MSGELTVELTVEVARFDRLKNLVGLIGELGPNIGAITDLLGGIDLGAIGPLFGAIRKYAGITSDIHTKAGIIDRVNGALEIARVWVTITPGPTDNDLLAWVDKIVGNPSTLEWIAGLVARFMPAADGQSSAIPVSVHSLGAVRVAADDSMVQATGLDWSQLIQVLTFLLDLILKFAAKKS